jgi:hypothetical protein
LNSTISGLRNPFDAIGEFKGEYRCIAADLRNANPGQSSGPLEIDRPWDSHTDDQLGVMDHLGVNKFMVMTRSRRLLAAVADSVLANAGSGRRWRGRRRRASSRQAADRAAGHRGGAEIRRSHQAP